MADMEVDGQRFDGFGVGGALEKENLGTIVSWVCEELGEDRPRHLLGISEPEDLFAGVAAGADTSTASTHRASHVMRRSTPPMGVLTLRTPASSAISHLWLRAANATPARTTRAPTSIISSRPRRFCRQRWLRFTTSGSPCVLSTASAPRSRRGVLMSSVPICSAATKLVDAANSWEQP